MALEFPDKSPSFLMMGPGGSGVSTALDVFSDFDFLTVAGVDPQQVHNTIGPLSQGEKPLAFSMKIGPDADAATIVQAVQTLKENLPGLNLKIFHLDAPKDTLIQRYLASDKTHAFLSEGLEQAVVAEKKLYAQIKETLKDYSIDTSTVNAAELKQKIARVLGRPVEASEFTLYLTTFGFKYGAPQDSEMIFDMRFMTNPFYDEKLRPMNGKDKPIRDFIFANDDARNFFENWSKLVASVIPLYQQQGKMRLNLAVGCTGGKHRSVCMGEELAAYLLANYPDVKVVMNHREMLKWGESPAQKASACPQGEVS